MLTDALIFLAGAAIAVPLSKRLGLGSVLGYLAAGTAVGPWGLKLIADVESTLHFAELGVVMLMFVIGLELQPSRLWELRRSVFGWGSAQVVGTAVALGAAALAFGLGWKPALVVGLGLSLSSTAFALQLLAEKDQLATDHGRAAFGILLFQDLAVIPILAALPFLSPIERISTEPGWLSAVKILLALGMLPLAGRFVLRPLFKLIASSHTQELFTAVALLIVLGTAALMSQVGLSMALGAFLAGVLLADSEYRHELEADIEPFKGLLLGLFFMAVGMSVNWGLVFERWGLILGLVLGLTAVKFAALFALGKTVLGTHRSALSLAVVISQGGEFAFVLFGLAAGAQIMDGELSELLVAVVTLSMAVTPLLYASYTRWLEPRLAKGPSRAFDVAPESATPVVIAGYGRVGQVVGRVLSAKGIQYTAIDASPEHIDFIKRFGAKVFYGDASRLDLLRSARVGESKVFVLAIDDVQASLRTAQAVKEHFPHVAIFARARNRQHAYQLRALGITNLMRETLLSSVEMTFGVLQSLGLSFSEARSSVDRFREYDEKMFEQAYEHAKDLNKLEQLAAQGRKELEQMLAQDTGQPR
jgi:glutathione-regulated potassium-efflux system ancillary protein KefC